MFKSGLSRFTRCLSLLAVSASLGLSGLSAQAGVMPPSPEIGAKGYVLLDLTTGQTLADFNSHERLEPASLTKLMTAYLAFAAIEAKQIKPDQVVPISTYAWKAEGSRMFVEPNKPVTVDELLKGVIVQSGNDASRAIAELLAGDEANFATLMNREAQRLGMKETSFKNATGLPDPQHYTTANDLAILAKRIILDFPGHYKLYSTKEYTYNGIRQPNRNRLLWIDPSVDGMKTGHTESAGYCLISSANRKLPNGSDRRLLAVVLGTASDQARTQESLKLLNYGFQMFDTVKLYSARQPIATSVVYKGQEKEIKLGVPKDLLINVPKGAAANLKASVEKKESLVAPIKAGTVLGNLKLTLENETLATIPLQALSTVDEAGFFGRMVDSAKMWINN
ncbi:D-alanyl-D-alanine carboxypeptidase [Limnobacter humi]|uniref:serine-type D-Ala-D-Ala carboxypeptidase n=1 Tax=Limnobacter humi TaxID=1778671 RepID=A0ABT1WD03_9BURK|nr:D-alanyl-D-alanine carboxypeptidase family protein [Limnobacter humi]MCQ8895396.1 D-alanyl-D-alanine carboxypeptidase [Limnobacter humi]